MAKLGDSLNYTLTYTNNSNVTFKSVNVSATLAGAMYDFSSLQTDGSFNSKTDTIAWSAANTPALEHNRTALIVELPDRPGSLCRFLTPLSENDINMKRLESRPIRGQPNKYRFYIEIEGSTADPRVQQALNQTRADGATIRSVGSYSAGLRFES